MAGLGNKQSVATVQQVKSLCIEFHKNTIESVSAQMVENAKKGIPYTNLPTSVPQPILGYFAEQGFTVIQMDFINYRWFRISL
jgi:hypothetical protein